MTEASTAGASTAEASTADVRLTDSTLRDGSHAMAHQFTEGQVRAVVHALDGAGVQVIEVTHGDGLGGSSFTYGFSLTDELRLIAAAVDEARRAKIAVLILPGVGTVDDLRNAHDAGASVARVATHCTEADVSLQHFAAARDLGMETVGFHGHQNLSLGIANSVLAYQHGATQIDGALCALGAGAGNAPTEILAATFDRLGIETGVDVSAALAAAEEVVRPFLPRIPWADRSAIVQGHAGVYSSFLLHAERAAQRYGVPAHEILQKAGEAGYVGGQEDMIIEIALDLAKSKEG
ncbi:MAG TPA: 4-hydroxy-2-oxovalerate aldolase [Streptosporangiaceae bacterium]|nr:4-hydroxy-2-oxovalerate aldolase [Streptosporangiaceae bacterium]